MDYSAAAPLIVQGDRSVLLEVNNALYEEARDHLARFAELEKSPEYIHTTAPDVIKAIHTLHPRLPTVGLDGSGGGCSWGRRTPRW